jgi:hypothetical protein
MFVGVLVMLLCAFGLIILIGTFEQANGLRINATIASNFNAIWPNPSAPNNGIFSGFGTLNSQVYSTSNSLQSYGPISSIISSVSIAGTFIFSIPAFYGLLAGFISAPLSFFMPVGFAVTIANVVLVGIFMLGLLSAIFLFPI